MAYNTTLARVRLVAVYGLLGAMALLARPSVRSVLAGAVLVALGEAIRFWAAGHLLKTAELVTSGPYRFTRNPLYLGRLLIFTGLCVMARLPHGLNWVVMLAGWAVFFGYYLPRKEKVEPARLSEVHGAPFDRYRAAVPALFPSWRPYPHGSDARWSSARMLRNREHWMVVALLAITLFLYWRAASGRA